jgi:hypothetical protein
MVAIMSVTFSMRLVGGTYEPGKLLVLVLLLVLFEDNSKRE